ncbi:MAG: T9SS type A sorting domain-containing protein [Bacteroidia bacterium]
MKTINYIAVIIIFSLNCLVPDISSAQAWKTYPYNPPNSALSFPDDDGYHPALSTQSEWWYINLHLIGSAPKFTEYDVMLVYFRFYNMRIFNMSALGKFNSNVLQVTPVLTYQLDKWDLTFTSLPSVNDYSKWTYPVDSIPYQYQFYAIDPTNNDELNITVTGNRAPLAVGGNGYIPLGDAGDSSFYYSYTNMKVAGSVKFSGVSDSLTSGIAWIDRQYGPFTVGTNTNDKYEWFSLQMDKQNTVLGQPQTPSEFNVWQIFSDTNSVPYEKEWRLVSTIFPDNSQDTSSTYFFERTGYWYDSIDNVYYSSKWRIIEPNHGVNIDITPKTSNQLVNVTLFKFWEGSTVLKGTVDSLPVTGVGFAELVQTHNSAILLPSVPSGLAVTPYANHNTLNWNASTAGTYPIGGYRIYRSPNNSGFWQYIASTTNLTYTDNSIATDSSYYYTVTSFDNQAATSASEYATPVLASPPLGIKTNYPVNGSLKIYPNPTTGKFTVQLSSVSGQPSIEIYNILGEKVYSQFTIHNSPFTIDLSGQPAGIYIVKVYITEKAYTEKLLLQ